MVALRATDASQASEASPVLSSRWPQFEPDEIDAVARVLAEGKVNALVHGEQTSAFETEFASYIGCRHALAVANGTLALELALRALDIGPGCEVIVPARSFFATASCVVAVGATPVFADVDPASQTICPQSVERMITPATRAIICVHLAGWPCDMPALKELCREHDLVLVEDCAQAHGAAIGDIRVGNLGDIGAFSFCTEKIISTGGEGGMLTLSDDAATRSAAAYRNHGKNFEKIREFGPGSQFRYVHDEFGSNYRLTEMQSAIGRRQLLKLPKWLALRERNAGILTECLGDHPLVRVPTPPAGITHAWYKYNLVVEIERLEARDSVVEIVDILRSRGITCGTGSCPDMSREEAFAGDAKPRRDGYLPGAEWLADRNLMLAVDHLFEPDEMREIGRIVADTIA